MEKTIALKNIEYTIADRTILRDVTFRATTRERLCLFGENGAGKSTLFRIITKELEADDGCIEHKGHIRFQSVSQEFPQDAMTLTVEEYIFSRGSRGVYNKVSSIAEELGYSPTKNKDKICKSLSGGQQKILALAVALADRPDFLLLDEPENHLDIVSRMRLIELLQEYSGGVIFVSHDRLLIDAVATKVGELAGGVLAMSEGGYDEYLALKERRLSGLQRTFDTKRKRLRQVQASLPILAQKAFRGKEVSAYKRALEEVKALRNELGDGRPEHKVTRIGLHTRQDGLHSSKLLLKVDKATFSYTEGGTSLFKDVQLEFRAGDRIVLLGRNGSGKSSFLRLLMRELEPTTGTVSWGTSISVAYFDQHARFAVGATPLSAVQASFDCNEETAKARLGAVKLDVRRMMLPIEQLSGGERMRVRLALVFGKKPDVVILDEPTNHIDEVTWEVLLDVCKKTESSLLLVTHDYEFIKDFEPTLFWMLHKKTVVPRHKELDTLLEELQG